MKSEKDSANSKGLCGKGGVYMSIEQNLTVIRKNIKDACKRTGRNPESVKILAVTKTVDAQTINKAIALGITDIGENRVQELLSKYDEVDKSAVWHIIGNLQKNKVKYIADKVFMIHSVESVGLAEEINKQCQKINKIMNILVEVNVSGEETKSGIKPEETAEFIKSICSLPNIRVKGLMTMAPFGADDSKLHQIFSTLYKISVDILTKKLDNVTMDYLSMGMSNDYVIAVEENSTMVRLGRGLFRQT